MTATITAGDLTAALTGAVDAIAAARDGFRNLPEDQAVLLDAEKLAQPLVGGAFSVLLGPILGPILIDALFLAIQYNESAEPGVLTRESSGRKGSNPWQE